MAFPPTRRNAGWAPQMIERRNSQYALDYLRDAFPTTTFSPVTRVNTVSGAASTNLIRPELIASGELFKRVNWIIASFSPGNWRNSSSAGNVVGLETLHHPGHIGHSEVCKKSQVLLGGVAQHPALFGNYGIGKLYTLLFQTFRFARRSPRQWHSGRSYSISSHRLITMRRL